MRAAEVPWPQEPPDDPMPEVDPYDEGGVQPSLTADADEWPEPEPLLSYADPLPTDALGDVLGPMVDAVAHTYQVPSDIAVTMGLPIVTTAAAGRWDIQVKPGWNETLALATMSILGSSGGKSPTLRKLAAPLQEFEIEAGASAAGDYARSKAEQEILKDRADRLRTEIKGIPEHKLIETSPQYADYLELHQRFVEACQALESHTTKAPPRWMVDDVTPEALAQVMSQQDGAIGIVSAEPGLFGTLGGRYSQGVANLDVVLKGVSGDRIQVDRKTSGAPTLTINHPVLSVSLGVQPGMMRRLGERAEFRESGMLGRFLPVMPPSLMGARLLDTDGVPEHVDLAWWNGIQSLAETAQMLRARGLRRTLVVTTEAEERLRGFRGRLEPEFLEGGRLEQLVDFGGKLAGAAVRIAGALTLLDDPNAESIDAVTMGAALRVADAYIAHAHTAFGTLSGGDPSTPGGRVLSWLVQNGERWVVQRAIQRAFQHKPWARSAKDLASVLDGLEAKGWVRKARRAAGAKGGRPSNGWEVNPRAFEMSSRRAQGPSLDPDLADGAA